MVLVRLDIYGVTLEEKKKRRKKSVLKRSMTVGYAAGRRNSISFVKQIGTGLMAMKRSNLTNSVINMSEDQDIDDLVKEVEDDTPKATTEDVRKCHFRRVFDGDSVR